MTIDFPRTGRAASPPRDGPLNAALWPNLVAGFGAEGSGGVGPQPAPSGPFATSSGIPRAEIAGPASDRLFEASRIALLLLDRAARLTLANRLGREVLARGDGLWSSERGLGGVGRSGRRFERAVSRAIRPDGDGARLSTSLLVERPSGRRPYAVTVSPLGSPRDVLAPSTVLVSVVDPDGRIADGAERIRALYGLTPSEARLAIGLADGRGLRAVAVALNLTELSARQYLARIFAKTGTGRQAELVRLLLLVTLAP